MEESSGCSGALLTDAPWTDYNQPGDNPGGLHTKSLAQAQQDMDDWNYRDFLKTRCLQYGPPPYSCTKVLFFIVDRSTFSNYEIEAMLLTASPAVIEDAFYIVVDGFSPNELGFTAATMQHTPALNPNPVIPGMTIIPDHMVFDDPVHLNRHQRLTWVYRISFTNTNGFTSAQITVTLPASISAAGDTATVSGTGYLYLIQQPNPYEIDGETSWLSTDLRVFQIKAGESKFGVAMGNNPTDFITQVIGKLNTGTAGQTFENDISTDQQTSRLELSQKVNNIPVYNFAIAKVRYRSRDYPATDVRVFFRLFTTATTSLEYNQATTYRKFEQAGKVIPLLGITNNEISAIPCFATPRINSASDSLTTQEDLPNILSIPLDAGGNVVVRYFGCWLDINQTDTQFPINPSPPDGPFTANRKSIQELIRNNHQCLVSEIAFTPSMAQNGSAPSTSDKLAQRNLAIVESANPGIAASRRIPHTFEIKPSTSKEEHDELMIDWGNLPAGSHATIYLPGLGTSKILQIAARKYRSHRFVRIDENTFKCDTGGITYLPLPFVEGSMPGMITVDLPEEIKKGQVFTVIARQVTGRFQRPSETAAMTGTRPGLRHIVGSFQITIPVREKGEILTNEERLLSNLRWIERAIPENNRWASVFGKYVMHTADRVDALGGDSKMVAASPSGDWKAAYRKCQILGIGTTLFTAMLVVSFGIPAAGLMTISGIVALVFLIGIANTWIKDCRPGMCQKIRTLMTGAVIGFLVLAILAMLGISGPYLIPSFLVSAIIAVVLAIIGRGKGCFPY
jgi:hypothetical protein